MGIFRKRTRHDGQMSPEASLAAAEAALWEQRRKLATGQQVQRRLERAGQEDDLAARFREAFGGSR